MMAAGMICLKLKEARNPDSEGWLGGALLADSRPSPLAAEALRPALT